MSRIIMPAYKPEWNIRYKQQCNIFLYIHRDLTYQTHTQMEVRGNRIPIGRIK